MSTSAHSLQTLGDAPIERRFYVRIAPPTPIYVPCGENNDGLVLNVSENGLMVSTPRQLQCNFVSRLSILLNGLPKPFQVHVRVVWTNESQKCAGIQLIDLTEYDREQIRKWGALETSRHTEKDRLLSIPEARGVLIPMPFCNRARSRQSRWFRPDRLLRE
jgi:hypothetical protein